MASEFFTSVIEEEKKRCDITNKRLKVAARIVNVGHRQQLLKNGSTNVDYNLPEIRCAYMYRYSILHSGMVTKYFRKMIRKKELKNKLKGSIKICSLGGGPGTDIIGVFKALAIIPFFHKRVTQVSVLDICDGWRNSFEDIMSGLLQGKIKDVPETFINREKFKQEFIEADLLTPLNEHIVEIIANADIICMIKFVSAILAKAGSLNALKVIGNLLKPGAFVLFIDNCQGDVSESIEVVFKQAGLETVMGPSQEKFIRASKSNLEVYGCVPQTCANISVVGWIKTNTKVIYEWPSISSLDFSSCDVKSEQDISVTSPFPDASGLDFNIYDAKSEQDISVTSPLPDVSGLDFSIYDAKSEQDISVTSQFPGVSGLDFNIYDAKSEQDISVTSPLPDVSGLDFSIYDAKSEQDISVTSPFPDVSGLDFSIYDAKSEQDISVTSQLPGVSGLDFNIYDAKSEQDISVTSQFPGVSGLDFNIYDAKSEQDISVTSPLPDVSGLDFSIYDAKSEQDISVTSPLPDVSGLDFSIYDAKSEQDISVTSQFPGVSGLDFNIYDAKSEEDISITTPYPDTSDYDEKINKLTSFNYCNKYTQTELGDSSELNEDIFTNESMINELSTLTEALVDLLQVTKRINEQNNQHAHHCCQCH